MDGPTVVANLPKEADIDAEVQLSNGVGKRPTASSPRGGPDTENVAFPGVNEKLRSPTPRKVYAARRS